MWKFKKSTGRKPPQKSWSREELKIIGWCMSVGIKISIMPDWKHALQYWQIDIDIKGKTHNDPTRYSSEDVLNKKMEYYKYYYYKHNTNKNG